MSEEEEVRELSEQLTPEELVGNIKEFRDDLQELLIKFNEQLSHLAFRFQGPAKDQTSMNEKYGYITKKYLVDLGFMLRCLEETADEVRKQAKAHKDVCSSRLCQRIIKHVLQYPSAEERARGEYASAAPNIKPIAILPKPGTDEYLELCEYFKVPEEARGIMSFNYVLTGTYLLRAANNGVNVPTGVLKKGGTQYDVIYRKLKGKS